MEDFSEEQQTSLTVQNKPGTREQPSQNKNSRDSWIIQITTRSIKNQGLPNFYMGLF